MIFDLIYDEYRDKVDIEAQALIKKIAPLLVNRSKGAVLAVGMNIFLNVCNDMDLEPEDVCGFVLTTYRLVREERRKMKDLE